MAAALITLAPVCARSAQPRHTTLRPTLLAAGLEGSLGSTVATEVASGARLLVDVETGPHHHLYGLSHGIWGGGVEGDPALPNTGALVRVNDDGGFTVVADHLNQPTSLEFIGNTAYFVSLAGKVWKIEGIFCSHPFR